MEQFYTLLTDVGKAKIANATALQTKVKFTKLLVGDSNGSYYEPTEIQTKLKNKVWEGGIGNISIDKDNPNWIVLESVIPSSVGGFTIREIGIEDEEGDLVVIAKYPQTYKPKIQDGSTKDLIIKTILEVTNVDTITLKVDPTIVLTTKKDLIDSQKNLEEKLNKKYMQTSIYDKNNNGIVDDSERLGNIPASMYIQKQNKITWQDLNINESMNTGDTPIIKLSRPKVTDELLLKPLNDNFSKIDDAINKAGYGLLYNLYNVSLDEITTSGTYMVQNLKNAPDIPYGGWRIYLVKCYVTDLVGNGRMYEIYSYGTGKRYLYDSVREKYSDIPCTSPIQDSEIYIDSINGDDTAAGYLHNPVKTWACAYSRIPKILTKPITINFLNDCEENVLLDNISTNRDFSQVLSTWIMIKGNNHTLHSLTMTDCHISGGSWGISLVEVSVVDDIRMISSSVANLNLCKATKIVGDNSVIRCDNSTVGTYIALNRSFIQVAHHTTPEIKQEVGCHATFGSTIYVQGTHPQGSTGEKYESTGGKVEYES